MFTFAKHLQPEFLIFFGGLVKFSFLQELVHTQQFYSWLHYRNNRLKEGSEIAGGLEKGPV